MKWIVPLSLGLTFGLAAAAPAQPVFRDYAEDTPVVLIGEITSQPRDAGIVVENKMQVALGPDRERYTLHLGDARLYGFRGREIRRDRLKDHMWVRAEGRVMNDPRRIRVSSLQVIAEDAAELRASAFYRPGFERGYLLSTGPDRVTQRYSEGTPVVVVGEVTSPPRDLGFQVERKMQVAVGRDGADYTLHLRDADLYDRFGVRMDREDLQRRMWVRAEGRVMDDPRRIEVDQLQVIGRDAAEARNSIYLGRGFEDGYVSAVAGTRDEILPDREERGGLAAPLTLVGRVTDDVTRFDEDRRVRLRVGGEEWTLDFPQDALVLDDRATRLPLRDVREGDWVRVLGWQTGDRRLRAVRLQDLGRESAFRSSRYYRESTPSGYSSRLSTERSELSHFKLTGPVLEVNRREGYLVMSKPFGGESRIYLDAVEATMNGRHVTLDDIRRGDTLTVEGWDIPLE